VDARLSVRLLLFPTVLALIVSGCGGNKQPAEGDNAAGGPGTVDQPTYDVAVPGVTPMPERVAVIGFLNKRNGIVRDLVLKPGQAVRIKDAIVRLRACEKTAPWESQTLTGAFIQLDVQRPDKQWQRAFSGWVYKESPSLNVVEHPVYDVWPKSCTMSFPPAPPAPDNSSASSSRSSAAKSGPAASGESAPAKPVAGAGADAPSGATPPPAPEAAVAPATAAANATE
jgi:hypothetical protein